MYYRRTHTAGATYFFTVNLADRKQPLLLDHADMLKKIITNVRANHPFEINAIVVLPEHLHCIWTMPVDDGDYSKRWSLIKSNFSRALPKGERISNSRVSKRERGIWQRRFWEHQIRNDADYRRHVDYIHINPVKHGYVHQVKDWPHSSFHRYVRQGLLPSDWGGEGVDTELVAGEESE